MSTFRLKNNHLTLEEDEELFFEIQGRPYKDFIAHFGVYVDIYSVDFASSKEFR